MNPVTRITPVTDAVAARMVSPGTLTDLREQLTATPVEAAAGTAHPAGHAVRRARARHRRLLIGTPVAAALAAVALAVTSSGHPGQRVGPVGVSPAAAQALSFTRHGGYIDVIIRNPLADPRRYRAEFAQHHMDIALKLIPVAPPFVGTLVVGYSGSGITPITAKICHNDHGD